MKRPRRILNNRGAEPADIPTEQPEDVLPPIPRDLAPRTSNLVDIRPAPLSLRDSACASCRFYRPVTSAAGWCQAHKLAVAAAETCPSHRLPTQDRREEYARRRASNRERYARFGADGEFDGPLALGVNEQGALYIQPNEQAVEEINRLAQQGRRANTMISMEAEELPSLAEEDFVHPRAPRYGGTFRNRVLEEERALEQRQEQIRRTGRCRNCVFADRTPVGDFICGNAFTSVTQVPGGHRCGSWEPRSNASRRILGLPETDED